MKGSIKSKIKNKMKEELGDFLRDESGVMSKENILKIGVGGAMALGALGGVNSAKGNRYDQLCDPASQEVQCCIYHESFAELHQRNIGGGRVRFEAYHGNSTGVAY